MHGFQLLYSSEFEREGVCLESYEGVAILIEPVVCDDFVEFKSTGDIEVLGVGFKELDADVYFYVSSGVGVCGSD